MTKDEAKAFIKELQERANRRYIDYQTSIDMHASFEMSLIPDDEDLEELKKPNKKDANK